MTPEERSLLERTCAIAEENNKILLSIRRSSRITSFMHIAYWVIIIGFSVGAYYFIQPYINSLMGVYGQAQVNVQSLQEAAGSLQDLLR